MKVAICIPTWNRANMLAIAIDSLLRQIEAKFDVHIFDDASPDFTENLIETNYAGKVSYHRSLANLGYVGNVNRCLNLANNYDWIGILQDDDCHLGESVATIIKYAKKYDKAGIIFSKYNSIDAEGNMIDLSEGKEQCWRAGLEAMKRCQGQIPCSATFYRAEAILGCGLYDPEFPYSADEEYATRIARNYDIVETKEILACYRRHPGHQMIRTWCKPDFIASFEKMRIRMAGYAGIKETEAIPIVRRDLAEIFKASAAWLAVEGHWYPAMRFHAYALKYNLKLYLGVKSIIHAILQSMPLIGKAYYRSRLGWSTQV